MIEARRDDASPAGRFLHAADLAGKQLPPARHEPRGRAGRGAVHAGNRGRARARRSVRSRAGDPEIGGAARRPARPLRQSRARGCGLQWRAGAGRGLACGSRRRFRARRATTSRSSPAARRTIGRARRAAQPSDAAPDDRRRAVSFWSRGSAAARDRRVIEAYCGPIEESPIAPWGVQVAGNFSKDDRARELTRGRAQRHAAILSDVAPMVIGTRLRSRGTRAFYRVRIPAATRDGGDRICEQAAQAGRRVRGVEELRVRRCRSPPPEAERRRGSRWGDARLAAYHSRSRADDPPAE